MSTLLFYRGVTLRPTVAVVEADPMTDAQATATQAAMVMANTILMVP
jgi:hypothetical protein